jgi:hypothetical protein
MPDEARKWLDDFLGAKYTSYSEALDDACAVIRRLLAANERLESNFEIARNSQIGAQRDYFYQKERAEQLEADIDIFKSPSEELFRRIRATEALGEFEARIASRACATGMPPDNTAQFPRVAECLENYARILEGEDE